MEGFWCYNSFKNEIKHLKQLYDFTYHLYTTEHENLRKSVSQKKSPVVSLRTSVGTITHNLDSLYQYTRVHYPNKLRQLILINAITSLEVFFTMLIREINSRDITPFKTDDKIDISRSLLLHHSTTKAIEHDLIEKDVRKLTSGGLDESKKYFSSKFQIDFSNIGMDYSIIQEIHERRHLIVHRNGYCDALYAKKYSQFGFKQGDLIIISHDYIISALDLLIDFGTKVNSSVLIKYTVNQRKCKSIPGQRIIDSSDIKLFVEFEYLRESFDLNRDILTKEIEGTTNETVNEYILQTISKDKKIIIFFSAPEWIIKKIMKIFKNDDTILLLNTTDIKF